MRLKSMSDASASALITQASPTALVGNTVTLPSRRMVLKSKVVSLAVCEISCGEAKAVPPQAAMIAIAEAREKIFYFS